MKKGSQPEGYERRVLPMELRVERRGEGDAQEVHIVGYAAVFGKDSLDLGGFVETIEPGAFKNALKGSDVRALVNHDAARILGRESAGTLVIEEDDKGLLVDITVPDTSAGRDIVVSIERGDVRGQSFGFRVKTDKWTEVEDGPDRRSLVEIAEIFDVGPVPFPAYPDTSVATRSLARLRVEREFPAPRRRRLERAQRALENEL